MDMHLHADVEWQNSVQHEKESVHLFKGKYCYTNRSKM